MTSNIKIGTLLGVCVLRCLITLLFYSQHWSYTNDHRALHMHTLYLMTSCVLRLRIPSLCPLTATGDDSPLPLSVMLPQNVGAVVVRNYDVGIIWYTVTEQTLRSSSSWQRTGNQCWITQKNCAIRKCCSSNVIYAGTWNMIDIRIRLMIGATEIINRKDCYYRNLMTKRKHVWIARNTKKDSLAAFDIRFSNLGVLSHFACRWCLETMNLLVHSSRYNSNSNFFQ